MNAVDHPPRPPLAFRVGIVGHRPDRLPNSSRPQLAVTIKAVLKSIKAEVLAAQGNHATLYQPAGPILRAISPLAEGTDRIFAEQAIEPELKFELCCVLPFPEAVLANDFKDSTSETDSLARFERLLGEAQTRIFILDGSKTDTDTAYGAAGRVVLNQSDLLVVVWDGWRKGKLGGTEETLDEARRTGLPVLWIDALQPSIWQLLDAGTPLPPVAGGRATPASGDATKALQKAVRAALALPPALENPSEHEPRRSIDPAGKLAEFYEERQPTWTLAVAWEGFRDLVADGKLPRLEFSIKPFEESVKLDWPSPADHQKPTPLEQAIEQARPYYAWPDRLAVLYSDRYRSAFILVFLLAALAVGLALLPFATGMADHHTPETVCIALELTIILTILLVVSEGQRRRWHERWLDYRLVAELVRHVRLVAPLGGSRPFPQVPAHWATYGQPGASWMAWYVRSVERSLSFPTVVINNQHLLVSLAEIEKLLLSQEAYHGLNSTRCHRIEEQLHKGGIGLLVLTLFCCGLHLAPVLSNGLELPPFLPPVLTFFCGFFPALGAAMAGTANQGEFRRITKRSEAMRQHLSGVLQQVKALQAEIQKSPVPAPRQYSVPTTALACDAARLLVNEVLDWRVVFLDQPLRPPA